MPTFRSRIEQFLASREIVTDIDQLTPDASTREYFRIDWINGTAIACVYPESFKAADQSYLDVTNLFSNVGLPVAEILDFDEELGVIIQEDMGDRILRDILVESGESDRDRLLLEAISLIPKIQAATD